MCSLYCILGYPGTGPTGYPSRPGTGPGGYPSTTPTPDGYPSTTAIGYPGRPGSAPGGYPSVTPPPGRPGGYPGQAGYPSVRPTPGFPSTPGYDGKCIILQLDSSLKFRLFIGTSGTPGVTPGYPSTGYPSPGPTGGPGSTLPSREYLPPVGK